MKNQKFEQIHINNDIATLIHTAFDMQLDISGGWGYKQGDALIIQELPMPLSQLQHTLASMRAYMEMNLTRSKEERYGAINLNEIKRESIEIVHRKYEKVTYEITAILEEKYADFIKEYKSGQGDAGFDISAHFENRKRETLIRKEPFWFDVTEVE
jgi:hypothetical protein